MSVYRLPKQCIKEIDQLCSSFLWSGPTMSITKAKPLGIMFVGRRRKEGWDYDPFRKQTGSAVSNSYGVFFRSLLYGSNGLKDI